MNPIRQPRGGRQKQRGAAAVEVALWLPILATLVCGMMDYGYYFWVSITATEAARVAARTASSAAVGACANAVPAAAAQTAATNAITAYMTQTRLQSTSNLTSAVDCTVDAVNGLNPLWRVKVTVDFPAPIGIIRHLMKASTRTTGWVKFATKDIYAVGR